MDKNKRGKVTVEFSVSSNLFDISTSLVTEYSSITSIGNAKLNLEEGYSSHNPNNIPSEKLMFMAVIYQAVLDATRKVTSNDSIEVQHNKMEALDWFTSPNEWEDYEYICTLAGVDPGVLSSTVIAIVEGRMPFDRKRINVLINNFDNDGEGFDE